MKLKSWNFVFIITFLLVLAACSNFNSKEGNQKNAGFASPSVDYIPATFTLPPIPSWTPTSIPSLTFTPPPSATPLPTATPTPTLLVDAGTPIPQELPVMNIVNAPAISALGEFSVDQLTDLVWSLDGNSLIAATVDDIQLYDVYTREMWRKLHPEYSGIRKIAISPHGEWLISSSQVGSESSGYLTNLERWRGLYLQPYGLIASIGRGLSDMAFSSNGLVLFTAFSSPEEFENRILFWHTNNWEMYSEMYAGTVLDLSISRVGDYMVTTPDRYAIKVWDLNATGKPLYTLYTAFTDAVTAAVFSSDGKMIATAHYDGKINLWDTATGALIRTMDTDAVVTSLSFSPDSSLLASGSAYEDHVVNIWWVDSGSVLTSLHGHDTGIEIVLFSPQGNLLVSASYDGMIKIWGIRP